MQKTIYALLVGINDYKSKSIRDLKGTENDVQAVHDYLTETYKEHVKIVTLCNAAATYTAVYETFITHLGQAKAGDTAFFYFSGHGSREAAPEEFYEEFPEGKNETLVCYDSGTEGVYCLADKELAVLIEQLAEKNPHIVVALDNCHSGSGTRNDEVEVIRWIGSLYSDRALESYAKGYYTKQLKTDKHIFIPNAAHISIAACSPRQWAVEAKGQGVFTKALLNYLKTTTEPTSYGKIFEQCGIQLLQQGYKQRPEVKAYGGLSIWTTFLSGTPQENVNRIYELHYDEVNEFWRINAGALNGIPYHKQDTHYVDIIENGVRIGEGRIKQTRLEYSLLVPLDVSLDDGKVYQIQLTTALSKSLYSVFTNCSAEEKATIFDLTYVRFVEEKDLDYADYLVIKTDKGHINVIHQPTQKLIEKVQNNDHLNAIFQKITWWENLRQLENTSSSLYPEEFEIDLATYQNGQYTSVKLGSEDISFNIVTDATGYSLQIPYKLYITNHSLVDVHVALLLISPMYGVYPFKNIKIPIGRKAILFEDANGMSFLKGQEKDSEATFQFKFIISRTAINSSSLQQNDFSKNLRIGAKADIYRFLDGQREEKSVSPLAEHDWLTKNLRIKLVRVRTEINPSKPIEVNGLKISKHATLKATVGTTYSKRSAKSVTYRSGEVPVSALSEQYKDVEILEFGGNTRSGHSQQDLLKLTNVQGEVSPENPLIIQSSNFETDDLVLPFVKRQDGLLIPVGYPSAEGELIIEHLPTEEEQQKGFRSAAKAVVLAFCKVTPLVSKLVTAFKLRRVTIQEKTEAIHYESDKELIQWQVNRSNRILLLIHGIIGSTESMAKLITTLDYDEHDTILAFDYENLNTPIEAIALNLQEQLNSLGIDSEQKIDILAHSMGGLVARYMIEKLNGHEYVNRLVMCGTPNGGSIFGKIATLRDYALLALGFHVNKVISLGTFLGGDSLLKILEKASILTTTLRQIQKDSTFLKLLNSTKVTQKIPYYIIAGNIQYYKPKEDYVYTEIMKVFANIVNYNIPNDIAVRVDRILKIDNKDRDYVHAINVDCHHLNYFTEQNSTTKIIEILKED